MPPSGSDGIDAGLVGGIKPVTPAMRVLLVVAGVLVFLAGVQLFVFSDNTDRFFAWTIDPPLTAAFLGASYWASVSFELVAASARRWADARIVVPTVFVFTTATLVVTLVHLDKFHLGVEFEGGTRAVTWAWIGVYSVVPVLMVVLAVLQHRVPGGDPPRTSPLPRWLWAVVALQAVVLLGMGVALLAAPLRTAAWWPWPLTALTGRAIGAWVLSLGVAAADSLWEDDTRRLRPAAVSFVLFGVLQGVALARYPDAVDWASWQLIGYVAFLAVAVGTGAATLAVDLGRRRPPSAATPPTAPSAPASALSRP